MQTLKVWSLLTAILFFMLSCGRREIPQSIAEVGSLKIPISAFKEYCMFHPGLTGIPDAREAKRLVLTALIAEKIIASDALAVDQSVPESMRLQMEQYEREAVIEGFWKEKIFAEIRIDENELRETYRRSKVKKTVHYLTFGDREDAYRAHQWYETHHNFEDLAAIRGYKPHEIPVDTLRYDGNLPNLQETAYGMKPGDVSEPVREGEYYVIIRVLNERREVFTSEEEFQQQKEHLRKEIRRQKAFRYFQSYVESYLKQDSFTLDPDVFKSLVRAAEGEIFRGRPADSGNLELLRLHEGLLDSLRSKTVVRFRDGTGWNGYELVMRLAVAPYPVIRSNRNSFRESMIRITRRIINDELLFRHARALGLDQRSHVREQISMWRDYTCFRKGLAGIIREAKHQISENTVASIADTSAYYDLYIEQYLLNRLPDYPVTINHAVLDTLQISGAGMAVFKTHFPKRTIVPPLQLFINMPRLYLAMWAD